MKQIVTLILSVLCAMTALFGQESSTPKQNIRGTIIDAASGLPIPYATIQLLEIPNYGTLSDMDGCFVMPNIPIGRYTIQAQMVGYTPSVLKEQLLIAGKELVVNISMSEDQQTLDEVVVKVKVNKLQPLNNTATVGARMFSVEEITRTPGGAEDPARLASSFAGVSADGATNGISIHGNAPHLLAWRIEGVEIPNPNHFADVSVAGAGIFSSLSTKVIGNSDFFTSAFPSEYNNAISGIFDMKLRNGNSQKYEHTFQAGVLGLEAASEGPIGKDKRASYLVNYRYSFLGLATDLGLADLNGQELKYQDLNFKVNIPTHNAGGFSVWGTSLIDNFKNPMKDKEDWETMDDSRTSKADQYMMALGLTHKFFFPSGSLLQTSVVYTGNTEKTTVDQLVTPEFFPNKFNGEKDEKPYENRFLETDKKISNFIMSMSFNKKYSAHYTNKSGVTFTRIFSDMQIDNSEDAASPMLRLVKTDDKTTHIIAYTHNMLHFGALTCNLGLAYQYLSLNDAYSIEPRIGLQYDVNDKFTVSAGYGIHSRKERTDIYFVQLNGQNVNEDLEFTRARHLTAGFTYKINDNTSLRVEPYYQYLYDIPVEQGTGFSILNSLDFIVDKDLAPKGKGRNYGVDITLERYLHKGWFGMITSSIFSSKFRASNGKWYHSRYDRNYIVNFVAGKEWMVGRTKSNIINVGAKYTLQGADRTTPIDYAATEADPDRVVQYQEDKIFTVKRDIDPVYAISFSYKINKDKISHSFVLDFIRSTAFYGHNYNFKKDKYDEVDVKLTFPQVAYRIEF
ncbi:MAG: TonB-dependent receptor [Bacteroidia bacterium]|nr:TonB-dependent receptor [Bacteroidia bacterium]